MRSARAAIEQAGSAGSYDTLAALRWGPRDGRQKMFEAALQRRGAEPRLLSAMFLALYDDEAPSLDDALAAVAAYGNALPEGIGRSWADVGRAQMYIHFGRFRAAASLLDSLRRANPSLSMNATLLPVLGGIVPDEVAAPDIALLDTAARAGAPPAMLWRGVVALVQGDTARLRTLLDRAPSPERPGTMMEEFEVLRGLYAVAMGDTAGGLRIARSALRRTRYGLQAGDAGSAARVLGLLAALVEATRPESRERAVGHLDLLTATDPSTALVLHGAIARTYEAAGLPDRAARLYSRFLRFWENADPEVQPQVDAARLKLERLVAEGAST